MEGGAGLIGVMEHAFSAAWVFTGTVFLPVCFRYQFRVAGAVPVGNPVARLPPAQGAQCRTSPGGTFKLDLASQKFKVKRIAVIFEPVAKLVQAAE